ncbi:MAG: MBL fold metallo-hydrolase [Ignavibacteriae bacterium]|nr:MBL fold metallo-hydrolase [Ignavibacteriota bacterium]NOG99719.1 MBL fold metallo-hydrolase [Ignavibacteriota bacterium]
MKIGKYNISLIQTGTFGLDGGAMFGIIPKPLWGKTNPADDKNRITLKVQCLLLQSDNKVILVDTGMGSYWDEKFTKIYNVDQSNDALVSSLKKNNLSPSDITDVILTHLHFDHTGGSVILENEKWVPAFPRAKYHVQKDQFEWAKNPTQKDRGSFIKERFIPLAEEGILHFINGQANFDDEIEFHPLNGHTIAMQALKISDASNTLFYCADLIPTSSHVPIPYVMGYDVQPLETVKEKNIFLPQAVEEDWTLIFEHDPFIAGAKVIKTERGFALGEKFKEI